MKTNNKTIWVVLSLLSIGISCTSSKKESKEKIIIKASNVVSKSIGVKGMTCVGCEITLEKSISKIKGVVKVKASATKNEAIVTFDKTKTDELTIVKAIADAGYQPSTSIKNK